MDKLQILYLEDNEVYANDVCTWLENMGHVVTYCIDQSYVRQKFKPDQIDIAILDIDIKENSSVGIEVARELLELRSDLPIIFLSAHVYEKGIRDFAISIEPDALLKKDRIDAEVLEHSIKLAWQKHKKSIDRAEIPLFLSKNLDYFFTDARLAGNDQLKSRYKFNFIEVLAIVKIKDKCHILTVTSPYEFFSNLPLERFKTDLPFPFVRISQDRLINFNAIDKITSRPNHVQKEKATDYKTFISLKNPPKALQSYGLDNLALGESYEAEFNQWVERYHIRPKK